MPDGEEMPVGDSCEGVICNRGEECVSGVCVGSDLCGGGRSIPCGRGEQCVNGVCVAGDPCEQMMCSAGEECVDGVCVAPDPCEQVMCNTGEECVNGECFTLDLCDTVGNSRLGIRLYVRHNCGSCHGTDAAGGSGPPLIGVGCDLIFLNLSGDDPHPLTVEGVTKQDAADLEAYLNLL